MHRPHTQVTRGHGYLEGFLALLRAAKANALIPPEHRTGRLLDIGCGCYPYLLTRSAFAAKMGVDKLIASTEQHDWTLNDPSIELVGFDIDKDDVLPVPSASVDVVTMLAVFEHIRVTRLTVLLNEVDRVLKPSGLFIMTTPNRWTGPILSVLKWLRMVSPVEIDEHQDSYSIASVRQILSQTRLGTYPLQCGRFELGMNLWFRLAKPVTLVEYVPVEDRVTVDADCPVEPRSAR